MKVTLFFPLQSCTAPKCTETVHTVHSEHWSTDKHCTHSSHIIGCTR